MPRYQRKQSASSTYLVMPIGSERDDIFIDEGDTKYM